MKRSLARMALFAVVAGWILVVMNPQAPAADLIYKMTGKITAIELPFRTVVIEVPLSKNKTFTVAGPLAQDAKLQKGGKAAGLADFSVGERVTVLWKGIPSGHLITGLMAR